MGTVIQSRILSWAWPVAMAMLLQAMMADPVTARDKGVASILTEDLYNEMLLHRNDRACPGRGFYNYSAFIAAASAFPNFGNQGNVDIRKRELAAFFGQTAHETTGGWLFAPDGQNAWGYCFAEVMTDYVYCERPSSLKQWPCAAGKNYYGRGPLMLKWNHKYGLASEALGLDLLRNPDLVSTNATVSFMTAISFWMKSSADGKPSCHDVTTGKWKPSSEDIDAGRLPGYGVITNIFNGAVDCGRGPDIRQDDRIGFYKRFCDILGVGYGRNVDCNHQRAFPWSSPSLPV